MAYDVIIIGAGSAGYAAGIYATRFGLRTLLIGKEPGGQVNEAYEIDNYPGFLGIGGLDLMTKFREHAEKLGVETAVSEVVDIGKKGGGFIVRTKDKEYQCKSVILATGSKKRKLDLPNEKELTGKGVAYCATCDAMFFKDRVVGVIGGGNAAVKSALLLTEHAKKVYIIYRKAKEDMRAMPYWVKKAEGNKRIEMVFKAIPKELNGKDRLESMVFEQEGRDFEIRMNGVFVEIGWIPENSLAKKLGVSLDGEGKIKVGPGMETNVEGVFAAGDITNGSNGMEQIVTSCAEGSIASESAYNYVNK
jgi:thioredoxin reductase (NADPH)